VITECIKDLDKPLDQWFSTGVSRNPWEPQKALGLPPIYEFDWYLLVKCSYRCRQIIKKLRKGAANQIKKKKSRNTALDSFIVSIFVTVVFSIGVNSLKILFCAK